MEIISRSEARQQGLAQYFTGMPCKNNHLTYRYTQSGTCAGCIRSYNAPVEILKTNVEVKMNLQKLVSFRTRVEDGDIGFISQLVLLSTQTREPGAQMKDVFKPGTGVKRIESSGIHQFNCFSEDLEGLRAAAVRIFNSRCVQIVRPPAYTPPPNEDWPKGDPR